MVKKITLLRITGWKARGLKILIGSLLLVIGGVMVFAGLSGPLVLENILILMFGAGFVFFGAYEYLSALRGDDLSIKYSNRGPTQE